MQPFIFITVLSGLTLSAAAPHALSHPRLHAARALDIEPRALNGPLVAGRQAQTFNKSPLGQCGGSSGYGCAPGLCCSQYGYCGSGPGYCGSDSSDASAATPSGGPLNATDPRYQSPNGAPGYGQPSVSGAAPASGGPAPSAAAASGSPPTYQPPAGSSAPAAPSPSTPAASPSPAPPAASPSSASPPAPSSSPSQGGGGSGGGAGYGNTYKMYSGNGSPSQGWPSSSDWMDFEGMWSANEPTIKISCAQFGTANPSDSEVTELKSAVQSVAQSAGLDPRFLLAIMMQESKGCVRVPTTDNGVVNPGLLQSHDGAGTCNKDGDIQNPCPSQEITQMLQDGAEGTSSGDGLKQCLSQTTGTDESAKYYQAATIYNSGNLPQNLDDNTATACYASDIANRMTGWTTATTQCTA